MRNDPPSTLSRRHGYQQARAAGLGGIRADRSPKQVNRYLKEQKTTREAIRELIEAKNDPEWVPFLIFRAGEGRTALEIATELYWMKRYSWAKEQGFSLAGRLRYHWPYLPYSN
jgi:hypothetical protein